VGLAPTHPAKDFGFKDRCVYCSAMRAQRKNMLRNAMAQEDYAMGGSTTKQDQTNRFRETARDLGADESDAALDRIMGKLDLRKKPEPEPAPDKK
jgi:hypothetical protein